MWYKDAVEKMKIGILSDTHFYHPDKMQLEPWITAAFAGADLIVHAGDVEHPEFFNLLREIAPVYAVRGNCDTHHSFDTPLSRSIDIGCGLLTVAHRAHHARAAVCAETRVMVYGHTHLSLINQENDLLIINPGSPTMPRGGMPPSVAVLTATNKELFAQLKHR